MDARFAFVVVAFATVALLMVLGLRIRLEPDSSRGWKPDPSPLPSPPRVFYVLQKAGYIVLAAGVALGAAIHRPWPFVVGYLVYVATISARCVIVIRQAKAARQQTAT